MKGYSRATVAWQHLERVLEDKTQARRTAGQSGKEGCFLEINCSLIDLSNYKGLSHISDPIFQLQKQ